MATANAAATERDLADRARFMVVDARARLPFGDESFDAVVCIDSVNHLFDRAAVLADWFRVLRAGGRLLFTNAVKLTGLVRREELVARSTSMGDFVFISAGLDERLVRDAGFDDVRVEDVSENAARVASDWRDARRGAATRSTGSRGRGERLDEPDAGRNVAPRGRAARLAVRLPRAPALSRSLLASFGHSSPTRHRDVHGRSPTAQTIRGGQMADVSARTPIFSRGSTVLDYWLAHAEGMTIQPLGARVEEVVVVAPVGRAETLVVRSRLTRRRKRIPADAIAAVAPRPATCS